MTARHAAPKSNGRRRSTARNRRTLLTVTALAGLSAVMVTAAAPGQAAAPKSREIVASYQKAKRGGGDERAFLRENRLLERVSDKINKRLKIPGTIRMAGRSCGNTDVAYDPEKSRIDVCYEFVAEVREMFEDAGGKNVRGSTAGVVSETLYHETAHALIDKLALPYTGREEDVADQFAAYNLIPQGMAGQRALLAAAENFHLYAIEEGQKVDFSDEHSPSAARAATYRSYLYGANPKRWKKLVDGKQLTRARSELSGYEYADLRRGWNHLLAPHRQRG
ncbi:DUF4344 domain-containing metallopeptidase [Streptomyces sp. H27-D2]|uniref:DUF4344 domain-containing metallopeptidase n=1 Tax=Streptomyces sp. H27-D2 TaxID=3046304 RepID=UPI002DBB1E3F|nr:DUF4344 domain-containing metallopeptidase [Streptomyces sp. H27-D2]MEC4019448.1 DUF4344 domain-containing metallopeptidase [Streptomyces sp. H27-D2]